MSPAVASSAPRSGLPGAQHIRAEDAQQNGRLCHTVGMPELDPAAVVEAVTRDPRLRVFTGHGRIETLPARQARRHLLLDKIAQAFEPGVRYSERQVSLFLGPCTPTMRRCAAIS